MANTIQHKRGTAAEWTAADPTLAAGQVGVETDTGKFKLGDGSTAWSALGYFEAAAPEVWTFQGENYGYVSGGTNGASGIQKFPFAADANSTNIANLIQPSLYGSAGQSSSESGYLTGGASPTYVNTIQKFSFSIDSDSTDVGDLVVANTYGSGQSSSENGYHSGGGAPTLRNAIEKFPFATDANSVNIGNLGADRTPYHGGQSSAENGYVVTYGTNTIEKFPFATDANATLVGTLFTSTGILGSCQSSDTHGYTSGLRYGPPTGIIYSDNILKNSFVTDGNAVDIANLTQARSWSSGQSSVSSGYASGGLAPPYSNVIDKFPFASDTNATDVGDLTVASSISTGQQY